MIELLLVGAMYALGVVLVGFIVWLLILLITWPIDLYEEIRRLKVDKEHANRYAEKWRERCEKAEGRR
jgi:hypothetical protein